MIHPLRQRHRRIFAVLAVILPVSLAVGVATRKSVPTLEALPPALAPRTLEFTSKIWSHDDLFAKTPIHAFLLREHENSGPLAIQLSAPNKFAKADLLIYWTSNSADVKDTIPDNAVLLGSFNGFGPLQLPGEFPSMQGKLILYSLADGEVVEVSKTVSLQ